MNKKRILKIFTSFVILFTSILTVKGADSYITVKSSSGLVIVGRTFNVTVTVSSNNNLGSWEYTIDYNSSILKLETGKTYIADYASNGTTKSRSYTYTFKALASGNPRISVKSYRGYSWDERELSFAVSPSNITTLTQQQLEATYSKNNNLSSITVDGYTLNPVFNKDVTSYTVELTPNTENVKINATVEDSKSSISGIGEKAVSEGENKIDIVVTAQNGSTKTYSINAIVKDESPIEVTTTNNEKMVVVKRESLLTSPITFTKTVTSINGIDVPAFYSDKTGYTLVGLKNKDGQINLYIHDKTNNTYHVYKEIIFNNIKLFPIELDNKVFNNYIKQNITLDGITVEAYKLNKSSDFSVIHAVDIETGKKDYYEYDSKENTVIRYNMEENILFNKKQNEYKKIIYILISIISILLISIILILIIKRKKKEKNKRKEIKL